MPRSRRHFSRARGQRRYRKFLVVAVEGAKTEPQYFRTINKMQKEVHIHCLSSKNDSSPPQVFKKMEAYLSNNPLTRKTDEAWMVIDKDQWTEEQLNQLHQWAITKDNYGLSVSNPNFEYWLLLHFEEGKGANNSRICSNRLKQHLPNYDKSINSKAINLENIKKAVQRAKASDKPQCIDWPRTPGSTTVYRLVEKIY
ncbi:MAG: RloB family protein [Bacillota bacterium]